MINLDGFEIIDELGSGGMATVWRARQISLDRDVAIKELSSHFATEPDDVARFQAEACTAGRLKHPGIVQVYDAFFRNGAYCFVMEFVDGYTIGDWLRRKGRLSERAALDVAECIADALDYAWKQFGMVHCDIKPDNVMIDNDGTVKLTDLGLSRTVRTLDPNSEQQQYVYGTPGYIAPEQAMGEADLDCRTDMYSLGAMLYHLVTGRMLFQGEPDERAMEMQVTGTVTHPRHLVPTLSPSFCDLLEKLLSKDRRHRHADWQQVRADIVSVRLHRPLANGFPRPHLSTIETDEDRAAALADHANAVLRAAPPRSPNRTTSAVAAGAAVVGVVAVLWVIARQMSRHDRQQRAAEQPARSAHRGVPVSRAAALLAEAQEWELHNVNRNAEIIARYQRVIDAAPASDEAGLAGMAIARVRARIAERCEEVLAMLQARTASLVDEGHFDQAIHAYQEYSGPYAQETIQRRLRIVDELKAQRQEQQIRIRNEAARHEERMRQLAIEEARREEVLRIMGTLLDTLDRDGVAGAEDRADQFAQEVPDAMQDARVVALRAILREAASTERAALQTYADHVGQPIELRTRSGVVSGRINRINWANGDLHVNRVAGTALAEVTISQRDLTLSERIRRMGAGDSAGARLAKALVCIDYGAFDYARELLEPLPQALRERVLARIPEGR